jgi:glycerol-3-phosphate dehydrogenase
VWGGQIECVEAFLAQETQRQGLSTAAMRHLVGHYGSAYTRVLQHRNDNSAPPPLHAEASGEEDALRRAEVLYGIREEMAQTLTDVILRRTNLGLTGSPDAACLRFCAAIMAREIGWDERRMRQEVDEAQTAVQRDDRPYE